MKLGSSAKYYLHSIIPAVIIFYIVMVCLSVVSIILSMTMPGDSVFGGISVASTIFLFVTGICSFTQEFRMFIQNGLTRKELWKSFIISSLIVSSAMSAIDLIALGILAIPMEVNSLIMAIPSLYVSNILLKIVLTYFLQIVFYTLALSAGYLIRLIYYRMNKFGKITVSIAVPGFFFVVLPIMSSFYNLEPIFGAFFGFLGRITRPDKFYGLPMMYLFFIVLIALVALINKLLIRKVTIK